MSTAVATAPAAPVTVTDSTTGATVTSAMTPMERHNAIAKSMGVATIERPVAPPQFHVDATVSTMVRQGAKLEAAKPTTPAAPVHDPARVAAFDAEMQAKGLQHQEQQRGPDGRFVGQGQPTTVDALYKQIYVDQLVQLYKDTPADKRNTTEWRRQWEQEYADAQNGRQRGESRPNFLIRTAQAPQQAHLPGREPTPPVKTFTAAEWQKGHESVANAAGYIPHDRIDKEGLSGYQLPKLVSGQTYHKSVFSQLASARKAGLSQETVTAFITQQMRDEGWLK